MDLYSILEIKKDCTEDEVKKSYRKLALKHHPDRGGETEKFKEIQKAYEILSDNNKRKIYDKTGKTDFHEQTQVSFQDILSQLFGNNNNKPNLLKVSDKVSLKELFFQKIHHLFLSLRQLIDNYFMKI